MLKVIHISRPNRSDQLADRLIAKWEKQKIKKHLKQIKPKP